MAVGMCWSADAGFGVLGGLLRMELLIHFPDRVAVCNSLSGIVILPMPAPYTIVVISVLKRVNHCPLRSKRCSPFAYFIHSTGDHPPPLRFRLFCSEQ